MDCQEYLLRFSEYLDGRTEEAVSKEIEVHRSGCERCDRYSRTFEAGRKILLSLDSLDVPVDFRPRLNHRIYHLEDGASIARQSLRSGATMVSVLTMAVLVAVSAWAPAIGLPERVVELPAVVVAAPSPPSFTQEPVRPTFPRNLSIFTTAEFQDGIWGNTHDLLREYSPILDRRRDQGMVRVGIE
jgi:hypothetical protein